MRAWGGSRNRQKGSRISKMLNRIGPNPNSRPHEIGPSLASASVPIRQSPTQLVL
jgi:hypothetical protein